MADIGAMYLDETFRSLRGHKRLADAAIAQLTDEEFFATPDTESNSVAVILKHMAGNMRSRFSGFLTTDGEKPTGTATRNLFPARRRALKFWRSGRNIGPWFLTPSTD